VSFRWEGGRGWEAQLSEVLIPGRGPPPILNVVAVTAQSTMSAEHLIFVLRHEFASASMV